MGSGDEVDLILRQAAEKWRLEADHSGIAEVSRKWSTPGGWTISNGSLGAPPAEFVVWVAAAAGSGLLGNAAYNAMKFLILSVRRRLQKRDEMPDGGPLLTEAEITFLAEATISVALIEEHGEKNAAITVQRAAWRDDGMTGFWTVHLRTSHGDYRLTIPDRRPEDLMVFGGDAGPVE